MVWNSLASSALIKEFSMPELGNSSVSAADTETSIYYPGPGQTWERKSPEAVGINPFLLEEAIAFANDPAHAGMPADIDAHLATIYSGKRYDDGAILGPTKVHGPVTGV